MGHLSDFQRGQIVGVCLAGMYVTKMVTLLGVHRAAVSVVMTEYANHGTTLTAKRNRGQKPRISERDCHTLKITASKFHRTTAENVQAELNIHFEDPASTKTVQKQLHKSTIHSTAATATPLITENNGKS
jgi:transposase